MPYRRTSQHPPAGSGPLAALVELIEGSRHAPPEQLPEILRAAGNALGVRITMYLVDYDQHELLPVPPAGEPGCAPLNLDATLAGRAFRLVQVVPAGEDPPRLWVPLLDGVERLGVLEVAAAPAVLDDPTLRRHCRWLATLLGHLVTSTGHYGDGLDRVRRRR